MVKLLDHDFGAADGGFWIKPDGTSIPVSEIGVSSSHTRIVEREFGRKATYYDAFAAGWVRISTFGSDYELCVNYSPHASVGALQQAAAIVRHITKSRNFDRTTLEVAGPTKEDSNLEYATFRGECRFDILARRVLRAALVKNSEARKAAAAVTAEAA